MKRLLVIDISLLGRVIQGIDAYCRVHGEWEYRFEPGSGPSTERCAKAAIKVWKADGIIATIENDRMERLVRNSGLPAVCVTGNVATTIPTVTGDDHLAGKMVARHFLESGFRNFGFFAETFFRPHVRKRHEGFSRELAKAGFACGLLTNNPASRSPSRWISLHERMDRWLRSTKKPVAIMCAVDARGQEAVWACKRLGLRVPDDVAIAGTGNQEILCEMCSPPLSSISPDPQRLGYEAAKLLDRLLRGGKAPAAPVLIPPREVVTRQSSDVVAISDPDIAAALRFIRSHAREPISVKDILREVPISRRAMERRFEEFLGRSPKAEIMRVHIERAKNLLGRSDLSVQSVALNSGFTNQQIFANSFRRVVGITASAFRKKSRMPQQPSTGSLAGPRW